MTALNAFGLFAVAAMLVFYALESAAHGSSLPSRLHARWVQSMAFCKARGRLARWKLCGHWWRYDAGGWRVPDHN
jgi:hypothetical protein